MAAFTFIVLLTLTAVFAGVLSPYDPALQNLRALNQPPSWDHLLGTDRFGRDILSRILHGSRISLQAAMIGLTIAAIGVPFGLIAGYTSSSSRAAVRTADSIMSRIADGLLALPPLIFAMAIVGALGAGLVKAMVAIGIVMAPRFFRVSRAAGQSVATEPYIEAARVEGMSSSRLLLRHVLPNASGPLLVQASIMVGVIIVAEASLSFLGLGVAVGEPSWGAELQVAFGNIRAHSWPIVPPALMIAFATVAFSLIGDALRDALGRDSRGRA